MLCPSHFTEAACKAAFWYTEVKKFRREDSSWKPPAVHSEALIGCPKLWQSTEYYGPSKSYIVFSPKQQKQLFSKLPKKAKLDIRDIYRHLALRRFDQGRCETIADQLGEPRYMGDGWFCAEIKMTKKEQAEYDPQQDNPDQGVWGRVWHGSKLYCVPNIIRHGLKSSDGSEEGHQFFPGKPGVYALPDEKARLTESYMINTSLPGRDGQYWKFCFEGVQKKNTTQTRHGQLWGPRDDIKLKYLWIHGSNVETTAITDWVYLAWEPSWEAPEQYARAEGHFEHEETGEAVAPEPPPVEPKGRPWKKGVGPTHFAASNSVFTRPSDINRVVSNPTLSLRNPPTLMPGEATMRPVWNNLTGSASSKPDVAYERMPPLPKSPERPRSRSSPARLQPRLRSPPRRRSRTRSPARLTPQTQRVRTVHGRRVKGSVGRSSV